MIWQQQKQLNRLVQDLDYPQVIAISGIMLLNVLFSSPSLARSWQSSSAGQGAIYVTGTLLESPCNMTMDSIYQDVQMGAVTTEYLKYLGEEANIAYFTLRLENCEREPTHAYDWITGGLSWSRNEPAIAVGFSATTIPSMPNYIAVTGASGIALKLSHISGEDIRLNEREKPELLIPGQNELTYKLTLVRAPYALTPGAWRAVIHFNMFYL